MVWRESNSRTFENEQSSVDQLLENVASSLFEWSMVWGFTTAVTVSDFVASLCSVILSTESL